MASKIAFTLSVLASTEAFTVVPNQKSSATALHMGLFDGVKDAFVAPALERSVIDSERETPIDRWMGWSVTRDEEKTEQAAGAWIRSSYVIDLVWTGRQGFLFCKIPFPILSLSAL